MKTITNINIPQLRFPEFSGEWEKKSLGEVLEKLESGVSVNSLDEPVKNSGEFGVLKTSSVYLGNFISNENKKIIDSEIKRARVNPTKDSILISRMNTPQLVGNSGLVDKDYPNLFVPDRLWLAKTNNLTNSKMLSIILSSEKVMSMISNIATGTSGSMKNISQPNFLNLNIFIPSLPEQERIASFLTAVDEKLQVLKKKKSLLEQYKKGVLQKIFRQEFRFKADDGSEFPEWKKKNLGEVFNIVQRPISKPKSNYLAIGIRSHFKGTFQKIDSDPSKIEMETLYSVKENDLIVNITFAWEGAVAIANRNDNDGLVSHRFPTYVNRQELLDINFFRYLFPNKKFKNHLELISPGGAGRNRVLRKDDFLKISITIPVLPEQTKIAKFLTSIDEKLNHVQSQIEKMELWKKGLLQKMFV